MYVCISCNVDCLACTRGLSQNSVGNSSGVIQLIEEEGEIWATKSSSNLHSNNILKVTIV